MDKFGQRLKKLRGRLVSQQQLAEKSGLTIATISKLERGSHQPSRGTIVKLAAALNVPPEVLWGGDAADASETVYVGLPRVVYDSIAERAKGRGLSVEDFITRVATLKTFRIIDRDPPTVDPPRSSSPVPEAPGTTGKPGRRRAHEQAR